MSITTLAPVTQHMTTLTAYRPHWTIAGEAEFVYAPADGRMYSRIVPIGDPAEGGWLVQSDCPTCDASTHETVGGSGFGDPQRDAWRARQCAELVADWHNNPTLPPCRRSTVTAF